MFSNMHYGSNTSYEKSVSIAKRRAEAFDRKKEAQDELKRLEIEQLKYQANLGINYESNVGKSDE